MPHVFRELVWLIQSEILLFLFDAFPEDFWGTRKKGWIVSSSIRNCLLSLEIKKKFYFPRFYLKEICSL